MSVKKYHCQRASQSILVNGKFSDPTWNLAAWTDDFIDIRGSGSPQPKFCTRAKMLWDQEYFYIAAELEESDVWGTLTEKNSIIYHDNDFEVFIDPDGDGLNYYEFEINALGTIWELTLDRSYKDGGTPDLGTNIEGLISKVSIDGVLNDPNSKDKGWKVELAIPWAGLKKYHKGGMSPPQIEDIWKLNFSRVQWQHEVVDGNYKRIPEHGTEIPWTEHPEDNWVWSPQGEINMHIPEMWGEVIFC